MYSVTMNLFHTAKYNGTFTFNTIQDACQKVRNNLDCACTNNDAAEGIESNGRVYYEDRYKSGYAVISKT